MNKCHDDTQSLTTAQAVNFLMNLMAYSDFSLNRWEQSCILLGLKQLGDKDLLPILKKAFHSPWPIVWEVAMENLNIWIEDEKEKEKILKMIMMENPNLAFNVYLKQQERI